MDGCWEHLGTWILCRHAMVEYKSRVSLWRGMHHIKVLCCFCVGDKHRAVKPRTPPTCPLSPRWVTDCSGFPSVQLKSLSRASDRERRAWGGGTAQQSVPLICPQILLPLHRSAPLFLGHFYVSGCDIMGQRPLSHSHFPWGAHLTPPYPHSQWIVGWLFVSGWVCGLGERLR